MFGVCYAVYSPLVSFPVTRISGVDGRALASEALMSNFDVDRHLKYVAKEIKSGMVGCNLSHFKAWKTFLESPYEYALVFEDDVSFDPKLLKAAIAHLLEVPNMWDFVNLENFHRSLNLPLAHLTNGFDLVLFLTPVTHAGCYLINRDAARKLISKVYPMFIPVDYYFSRTWELDLKFTGIVPNLVTQSMGTSNIDETKSVMDNPQPWHQKVKIQTTRAIYRVKSDVARFVYTLYQYINLKA